MKPSTDSSILLLGISFALIGSLVFNAYLIYSLQEYRHKLAIQTTEMAIMTERDQYYQQQLNQRSDSLAKLNQDVQQSAQVDPQK